MALLEFVSDDIEGRPVYRHQQPAPGLVEVHSGPGGCSGSQEMEQDIPESKPMPQLKLFHVVAITFFAVSGGPYGFEDVVGAGGGWVALIACFILPIFWSLPLGLMTAELSSLLPENGGFIVWVNRAFGPYTSWINSMFGVCNAMTDNALYPIMFVDYINTLLLETQRGRMALPVELVVKVTFVLMVTLLNVFGVDAVGEATVVFGGLVMFPFVALVVAGLPKVAENFRETPPQPQSKMQLGRFLAVMAWNNCGWDSTGNCAAEICEPEKTLPKAMFIAVGMITLNYVLPLLIALPVVPDPNDWTDGTWVAVGNRIAGPWLSHWIALMAMVSALGMFSALLCTTSRLIYGVASSGQLPKALTRLHYRFKTPVNAILLNAFTTILICTFPGINFAKCAEIAMMFYLSTTVLKFIALIRLRKKMADAPRPFRIPMSDRVLTAFIVPPILTCLISMFYMDWFAWILFVLAFIVASIAYRYTVDPAEPTSLVNAFGEPFDRGKGAAVEMAETSRLLAALNGHGTMNGNGTHYSEGPRTEEDAVPGPLSPRQKEPSPPAGSVSLRGTLSEMAIIGSVGPGSPAVGMAMGGLGIGGVVPVAVAADPEEAQESPGPGPGPPSAVRKKAKVLKSPSFRRKVAND